MEEVNKRMMRRMLRSMMNAAEGFLNAMDKAEKQPDSNPAENLQVYVNCMMAMNHLSSAILKAWQILVADEDEDIRIAKQWNQIRSQTERSEGSYGETGNESQA